MVLFVMKLLPLHLIFHPSPAVCISSSKVCRPPAKLPNFKNTRPLLLLLHLQHQLLLLLCSQRILLLLPLLHLFAVSFHPQSLQSYKKKLKRGLQVYNGDCKVCQGAPAPSASSFCQSHFTLTVYKACKGAPPPSASSFCQSRFTQTLQSLKRGLQSLQCGQQSLQRGSCSLCLSFCRLISLTAARSPPSCSKLKTSNNSPSSKFALRLLLQHQLPQPLLHAPLSSLCCAFLQCRIALTTASTIQ